MKMMNTIMAGTAKSYGNSSGRCHSRPSSLFREEREPLPALFFHATATVEAAKIANEGVKLD
jgi:hypothetical protein